MGNGCAWNMLAQLPKVISCFAFHADPARNRAVAVDRPHSFQASIDFEWPASGFVR